MKTFCDSCGSANAQIISKPDCAEIKCPDCGTIDRVWNEDTFTEKTPMLTLAHFDNVMANRDIDSTFMDATFRESIREAIMARDSLQERLNQANMALDKLQVQLAQAKDVPINAKENQDKS